MERYDPDRTCAKCGGRQTKDVWSPAGTEFVSWGTNRELPERIRRTCMNCGYTWREAPLHAEATP